MSGWAKIPNEAWAEVAALLEAKGDPWSEAMQIGDLRWWAGQSRIGSARRIPGYRKLAARWSVSDWDARELMKAEHKWKTASETISAQSPRTVRAEPAQSGTVETKEPKNPRAVAAQSTRSGRDTRGGEDIRHKTQDSLLLQPPTEPPAKTTPPITPEVHEAHEAFKRTHVKAYQPLKASKGEGLNIAALVKEHGVEEVASLYRWAATSDHTKAKLMRGQLENKEGGLYSSRPAKWLRVSSGEHWDEVFDAMNALPAVQKPTATHNSPAASPRGHEYKTPADRWEGVLQQSGYAAGWHEQIEPENRARYRAASGAVGGPNALGGITWPPDVNAMKERFNKAYNNYSERK